MWLREDLRLDDHPALTAAIERGAPLHLVYVLDDDSPEVRTLGGAARWWLHHSLEALDAALRGQGGRLHLRRGPAEDVIPAIVEEIGADAVHWTRRYGAAREGDARIKSALRAAGPNPALAVMLVAYELSRHRDARAVDRHDGAGRPVPRLHPVLASVPPARCRTPVAAIAARRRHLGRRRIR